MRCLAHYLVCDTKGLGLTDLGTTLLNVQCQITPGVFVSLRARDNLELFCLLEREVQSALNASARLSYCKTFRGYHITA